MALDGRFQPVVEFMYADFMWVAADQLFNQVAKARHMFGGDNAVPFVLRSKLAAGTGYGSQHSMDPAGILATAPGLRVVAPSTPFDYVGLVNTALACEDPVVVLEHVDLYTDHRHRPRGRPRLPPAGREGRRAHAGLRPHRHLLPDDGRSLPRGARGSPGGVRGPHRPALAGSRLAGLGHDRGQRAEDQPGPHRRAGRRRDVVRRMARRRDPAAALRLARRPGRARPRRRGVTEHQQGARAGRDRQDRRGRRRLAAIAAE